MHTNFCFYLLLFVMIDNINNTLGTFNNLNLVNYYQ